MGAEKRGRSEGVHESVRWARRSNWRARARTARQHRARHGQFSRVQLEPPRRSLSLSSLPSSPLHRASPAAQLAIAAAGRVSTSVPPPAGACRTRREPRFAKTCSRERGERDREREGATEKARLKTKEGGQRGAEPEEGTWRPGRRKLRGGGTGTLVDVSVRGAVVGGEGDDALFGRDREERVRDEAEWRGEGRRRTTERGDGWGKERREEGRDGGRRRQ